MSTMVFFYAVLFPRDVLDEILNLIESVSEGFPTYSLSYFSQKLLLISMVRYINGPFQSYCENI